MPTAVDEVSSFLDKAVDISSDKYPDLDEPTIVAFAVEELRDALLALARRLDRLMPSE
jgi:hypothetical protein